MKCLILFSEKKKNKKNITDLFSAEFADRGLWLKNYIVQVFTGQFGKIFSSKSDNVISYLFLIVDHQVKEKRWTCEVRKKMLTHLLHSWNQKEKVSCFELSRKR